jgi:RNA polymerase sigma-70 factor (ECF subfamily)
MFISKAIPDILLAAGAAGETCLVYRPGEKVHVGMTSDQSANFHGMEASFANDADALTLLYEQFRRPIHSYVYRLLGNLEDADDLTQEVFVRACTAWKSLYERDNLSAWLYRIATNLCVDVLRRRKRISWRSLSFHFAGSDRFDGEENEAASWLLSDSGGIPEIAERDHIRLVLAHMPVEYAVVLVLSAAQGVPYQEIATIIGLSPNAAATRISRAKRMFAEHYQRINKEGVAKQEYTQ